MVTCRLVGSGTRNFSQLSLKRAHDAPRGRVTESMDRTSRAYGRMSEPPDTATCGSTSAEVRDDSRVERSSAGQDRKRLSPPLAIDPGRLEADRRAWLERSRLAWDARAERWDRRAEDNALAPDRERALDRIWKALRLHPGVRVLDAGCGSGQFAIALAARGARVTGIDLSPEMIGRAREHAAASGATIDWRTGDVTRLAEPLAIYDAILARVLLQFVPDVPAALREFRRVLRPGGRLLASVPGALSPIYRASWMRHLPGGDPGNNYLLPWELEDLLHEQGWRVVDGWGDWGEDLYGTNNEVDGSLQSANVRLQQATATTWTIVAG
jgi:2-polyprenyl-3-methyl-5-hydroxy-6-metoxy-1,4-benzoquinol methylase